MCILGRREETLVGRLKAGERAGHVEVLLDVLIEPVQAVVVGHTPKVIAVHTAHPSWQRCPERQCWQLRFGF